MKTKMNKGTRCLIVALLVLIIVTAVSAAVLYYIGHKTSNKTTNRTTEIVRQDAETTVAETTTVAEAEAKAVEAEAELVVDQTSTHLEIVDGVEILVLDWCQGEGGVWYHWNGTDYVATNATTK